MTDIDAEALDDARYLVALDKARHVFVEPGALRLARALLSLHARVESMAAVVAAAEAVVRGEAETRIWRAVMNLRAALDGYGGAK